VGCKVTVPKYQASTVKDGEFWPDYITCRDWSFSAKADNRLKGIGCGTWLMRRTPGMQRPTTPNTRMNIDSGEDKLGYIKEYCTALIILHQCIMCHELASITEIYDDEH
jgi:hypothetical protein